MDITNRSDALASRTHVAQVSSDATLSSARGWTMHLLEELRDALRDTYRVESEIGRGGMACVYLAEDLKHGRRVALKVLSPELS